MTSDEPTDDLLTIGAFARLVGLTPSALRFYDDCGLLPPREIGPQTGYRYYAHDQRRSAVLLRRTRELELPLAQVEVVLAGPPDRAAAILRDHAASLGVQAERTARIAADLIASLEGEARAGSDQESIGEDRITVEAAGPELAGAIRQVRAAATEPAAGVLLELDDSGTELSVVGSGNAWLAVRTLGARGSGAGLGRALVRRLAIAATDADPLVELARRNDRVTIRFGGGRSTDADPAIEAETETRTLARVPDLYPSHRAVLSELSPFRSRVIMDRSPAVEAIPSDAGSVRLVVDHDHVEFHVLGRAPVHVPAVCRGASMTIAFATDVLAAALDSAIGPDILLELIGPDRPALVRSADQGSFTLLIMPQRPV